MASNVDLTLEAFTILREYFFDPKGEWVFYCYRLAGDIQRDHYITDLRDPFPTPLSRSTLTQSRGRFRLPIEPL